MKTIAVALICSAVVSSTVGLAIPAQGLEARNDWGEGNQKSNTKVKQVANAPGVVEADNGGYAYNGDTTAKSYKGLGLAIPIAYAQGGNNQAQGGTATNTNTIKNRSFGEKNTKVNQAANAGGYVDADNSGWASNGETNAKSGWHGSSFAVPIAYAQGGDNSATGGTASNTNKIDERDMVYVLVPRNWQDQKTSKSKVDQSSNAGGYVIASNGGYADNGNTDASGGLIGVAVPVAIGKGGNNKATGGTASNSNSQKNQNEGSNKSNVKQVANAPGVINADNSGNAENGDTSSSGLVAVAVPIAVAQGGNNNAQGGTATNSNKQH